MSKQEQLIEYITQDIVCFIMEDEGIDMISAMHRFYTSVTFEKLSDIETGLYLDSSASVYDMYLNECRHGKLVQNEI